MWVLRTTPTKEGRKRYGPEYRDMDFHIIRHLLSTLPGLNTFVYWSDSDLSVRGSELRRRCIIDCSLAPPAIFDEAAALPLYVLKLGGAPDASPPRGLGRGGGGGGGLGGATASGSAGCSTGGVREGRAKRLRM